MYKPLISSRMIIAMVFALLCGAYAFYPSIVDAIFYRHSSAADTNLSADKNPINLSYSADTDQQKLANERPYLNDLKHLDNLNHQQLTQLSEGALTKNNPKSVGNPPYQSNLPMPPKAPAENQNNSQQYAEQFEQYLAEITEQETTSNPGFAMEYQQQLDFLISGYTDIPTVDLKSMAKNGDPMASLAITHLADIDKKARAQFAKQAIDAGLMSGYFQFAKHVGKGALEKEMAYLLAAAESGSQLARFAVTMEQQNYAANEISLSSQRLEEYLVEARKEFQFDELQN